MHVLAAAGEVGEGGGLGDLLGGVFSVGDLGLGSFVLLIFLLVFTGRLVPKRHLDDCREDLKSARVTNENQAATIAQMGGTLRELVELARSADHLLREFQTHAEAEKARREAQSS